MIPEDMPRKIWLGIIVAVDDVDNCVEILCDDGEKYKIYLDNEIEKYEVENFWEVISESE